MSDFSQMVQTGCVPHALVFAGKAGVSLADLAKKFAIELLGKHPHPDVHEFFPEGKTGMHPVSHLRKLTEQVGLAPYQGKWKLFILYEADRMLPTSSNALLKTLEEPTLQTVILLLTHHPEKLLPTVISRCRTLRFSFQASTPRHKILKILAGEKGCDILEEKPEQGEEIEEILETICLWYRDRLLLHMGWDKSYLNYPEYEEAIRKTPFIPLEQVEKHLQEIRLGYDRSMKLSLCLETLFLRLCKEVQSL